MASSGSSVLQPPAMKPNKRKMEDNSLAASSSIHSDNLDLSEKLRFVTVQEVLEQSEWLQFIDSNFNSFKEKVSAIVLAAECPPEFLTLYEETVREIETRLQKQMRNKKLKAYAFGSSRTNLGFKGCDLDLFIKLDQEMENVKALKTLQKNFYRYEFRDVFSKIIYIKAKVPILKCEHILNFGCDISVDNGLARHNTDLITFYLSLNQRYRNFFFLLKLWAKRLKLVNSYAFKSYTIILMAIFYLQQRDMAPSVQTLQASCKPRLLNGWNSAFSADQSSYQQIKDTEISCYDLLKGFFELYSTFDFGFYVISPFLGKVCQKPLDADQFPLLREGKTFDETKFISVQDVFQHDFNTASAVTKEQLVKFQSKCADSYNNLKDMTEDQLLVENLFGTEEKLSKKRRVIEKRRKQLEEGEVILYPKGPVSTLAPEEDIHRAWIKSMIGKVKDLLKSVLLATITQESDLSLDCQSSFDVFDNRLRSMIKSPEVKNATLDEIKEKSEAVSRIPEAGLPTPLALCVNFEPLTKPTRLVVKLAPPNDGYVKFESLIHLRNFREGFAKCTDLLGT